MRAGRRAALCALTAASPAGALQVLPPPPLGECAGTFEKGGRVFRRVPSRIEASVPKAAAGRAVRGGFYYGWFRGEDGKLVWGKMYAPHYGGFDGSAHNNPPGLREPCPDLNPPPQAYRVHRDPPARRMRRVR